MSSYYSPENIYEDLKRKIAEKRSGAVNSAKNNEILSSMQVVRDTGLLQPNNLDLSRLEIPEQVPPHPEQLTFREIDQFYDQKFINVVYQSLLDREPDENGYTYYLNALRSGRFSKAEVVGRIRYSSEGRSKARPVKGLLRPLSFALLSKVPVFGYLLTVFVNIFQLPDLKKRIALLEKEISLKDFELRKHLNSWSASLETEINRTARYESLLTVLTDLERAVNARATEEQVKALVSEFEGATAESFQQLDTSVKDLKYSVIDQQRRLALLLEDARKRLPEPISQEQIATMLAEEDHLLDALYVSFEDRFRGTRQDIKNRVGIYLPLIEEAKAGTEKYPVLDLGCGRGEWLELLRENNFHSRGIDTNRVMLELCRELELEVIEADAIACLREQKSNSIGAITAIHLIEHIGFKNIIVMLDECLRILKPGGVIILETPNPENIVVGACNFYNDPSHLKPLPPELMSFIVEARGFSKVEIMRLHQRVEQQKVLEPVSAELASIIGGSQDYAVIGYKI